MKIFVKRLINILLMNVILIASIITADASNPIPEYMSLHGDFGRADAETGYYRVPGVLVTGYISCFRVFIPPGTLTVTLSIYEWGGQSVRARYKIPPTIKSTAGAYDPGARTLEELADADQLIAENAEGKITILDYPNDSVITDDQANWLYVYVAGGSSNTPIYNNSFIIAVDAAIYNEWYDSINWDTDVEGVITYLPPNPLPGTPVVNPQNYNWTTAPQTVTVTCAGADSIVANVESTPPDGSEPPSPVAPTSTSYKESNNGGSTWTLTLPAIIQSGITKYKYRFMGINDNGSGNATSECVYTLDLSPYPPGAVVVSPSSGGKSTAPQNISVTSAKSSKIYYNLSTDGSPSAPNQGSSFVTGPSGTLSLEGVAGQSTTYRILFKAYNQNSDLWSDVSSEYTYTIDRIPVPPAAVTVGTPSGTSWTSAPQSVNISSIGATKIYASAVTTVDGSEPGEPSPPSESSAVVVNGSTGSYSVPSNVGKTTRTKVRFCGHNDTGFGVASSVYFYSIVLPTGTLPGAVTVNPSEGTFYDANHAISVSSSNADYIYMQQSITTDGTEPAAPTDPFNGFGATRKTGSSCTFELPSTPGKTTRVKMAFGGSNEIGNGPISPVHSYTVTVSQSSTSLPGAVTVTPGNSSWNTATWATVNHTIQLSSEGASKIDYAYNITTDGSAPVEPTDPSVSNNPITNPFLPKTTSASASTAEIRGSVTGPTGTFTIPFTPGVINKIKIKFCGENTNDYGPTTNTYSYTIDLKTPVLVPAAVVVNPGSTSWTTALQKIAVSSVNATQINYTYTNTVDGSEPPVPTDPNTDTVVAGQVSSFIPGGGTAPVNFNVPSSANTNTRIKIKFCGKNGDIYGTPTAVYSYSINLKTAYKSGDTITPYDVKAVPGVDLSPMVLTTVNGEKVIDPSKPFYVLNATTTYSVADLLRNYLRTALNDPSIQTVTSADGVLTITSSNFSEIYTLITGSLVTTAEYDVMQLNDLGDLEVWTDNIKFTFYPAGADQATFKKTLEENYKLGISYGPNHVMKVLVDTPDVYMLAFRFQFFALKSTLVMDSSTQCQITDNGNGTIAVNYPNGMVQNIVPYVQDPAAFAESAKLFYGAGYGCELDSNTGTVSIKNTKDQSTFWKGAPDCVLLAPKETVTTPEVQLSQENSSDILFITNQGEQIIFKAE